MDLRAHQIKSAGNIMSERLVLLCRCDLNTFEYGVGKAYGDREGFHPILSVFFMLPSIAMGKGDMLSIYTKGGVPGNFQVKGNKTVHRIYMGLTEPLWKEGENIIITRLSDHSMKVAQDIITS